MDGPHELIVTFQGIRAGDEVPARGFVDAIAPDGWVRMLLAGSVLDEWRKHAAVLEAVLDSVQFTD